MKTLLALVLLVLAVAVVQAVRAQAPDFTFWFSMDQKNGTITLRARDFERIIARQIDMAKELDTFKKGASCI